MNLPFFKKKTIIELLEQHLSGMNHDQKIEHLKAIVPLVCPGVNVSKNPPKGVKRARAVSHADI